ncbi:MAG: hypothetical protein HN940_07335 [Planctomycetes bacterium]|jgi:hypothetical protein|nr:hypothetical protein [Planctomycetota bacterium]
MFDAKVDIASVGVGGGMTPIHRQFELRLEFQRDVGKPKGTAIDDEIMNRAIIASE